MPVKQDVYYGITANFTSPSFHDLGIQLETISKSISRISLVCAFKTRDAGWAVNVGRTFAEYVFILYCGSARLPADIPRRYLGIVSCNGNFEPHANFYP